MDSVPNKSIVALKFERLRVEGSLSAPPEVHELLLYLVADIQLQWRSQRIYKEVSFPLVELAEAFLKWKVTHRPGQDFNFYSMESADGPLIYFRHDGDGYIVGSVFQELSCSESVSANEIDVMMAEFCNAVRAQTVELVGFDAVERVMI